MKKIILLLSVMFATCVMVHVNAQTATTPDVLPQFPGGDTALYEFVSQNLVYPQQAVNDKVEGNVFVEFIITVDGEVVNAKILRGLTPECDAEVLRIVGLMPRWTPAVDDGKRVDARFVLPISFKL